MKNDTQKWILHQIKCFRKSTSSAPVLPFTEVLVPELVNEILRELHVTFRQRIYTPFITLCVFLWQVLSEDHSCREAVARLMAFHVANGRKPCSPDTNPYCRARKRLPEKLFQLLVQKVGKWLQKSVPDAWRFHGRRVKSVDGSTVSMPDTPENQKAYPQSESQAPGIGFPIARLVVLFCVASGAALEMAIGPYRGKKTGETSLFRTLWDSLETDDIVLADRCYCSFADITLLGQRGVDIVFRKHQKRHSDFRRGKRLGKQDHLITWKKPKQRPPWMDHETFDALPEELTLREIKFTITEKGKRTKEIILVTTLLDAEVFTQEELADLYNIRWRAEIDLRSLKSVMEMDVLRCKTPEMVRKEVWTHLLAYNLIRTAIAKAAEAHKRQPHEISFKGAMQTINCFRDYMLMDLTSDWYAELLKAIAYHAVGNRPGRYEPRARKRRPKQYPLLQIPRDEARKRKPGKTYD
jgi:hypothetical protein